MTKSAARLAAAALLALACIVPCAPARATSYSVDYSDLWWAVPAESESGWGVNVVQQDDTLFLTFFVYGPDKSPRWYVASAVTPTNPQPSTGTRFAGTLYSTTGPWFGGAFDPAQVGVTPVGNVTVTFDSPSTGTLSYTVDGTAVVKAIGRQSWKATSAGGSYAGGLVALASSCGTASDNGQVDWLGTTTVTQTATQLTVKVAFVAASGAPATCTLVGNYALQGRLLAVPSGSFSCIVNGFQANSGVFALSALDAQANGFHATFSGQDQFCTYNGRLGGTRNPTG